MTTAYKGKAFIQKPRGAILRNKPRWHEEGEKKSTKFFANLEKINYS